MDNHRARIGWVLPAFFALVLSLSLVAFSAQQQQQKSQQPSEPAPSLNGTGSQNQQNQPADQNQPAPSLRNPQQNKPAAAPSPSPAETQAYNALIQELDPDKQLNLALSFIKQYPNSPLLSDVYFLAGGAEERKNDVPDAIKYGQESLKIAPNNLRSLILMAGLLPLPQALQGTDNQKEQQLTAAEDDASRALQIIPKIPPPANYPKDQFDRGIQAVESQLHSALGMAHLEKAVLTPGTLSTTELSQAEQEYKAAVTTPQPVAQDYYRLGEVCTRESKWDDAINAFTQAAQLGQGTMIAKYANDMIQKVKAQQAKSPSTPAAAAPAAPATPPPPPAKP